VKDKDYSEETRSVYHKQHMRIADDDIAMNRFIGMFSTEYFGLGDDYFKGKRVLDAGCGDTGKIMIALSRFGATDIHGIDLGEEFIPVVKASMERYGVPEDIVTVKSGSVLEIPYEDDYFDFVVCHGVLVHLNNIEEVECAFSELARVTKPNGYLYTVYGLIGGLFEEAIVPAVRQYYLENNEFKEFVDNISPADFTSAQDLIDKIAEEQLGTSLNMKSRGELFDMDLCVFIQNLIQAPVRLTIKEEIVRQFYLGKQFTDPRRLRRYVERKNIRKYFAPLHYETDFPISKILYGSGNLEFLGRKANECVDDN